MKSCHFYRITQFSSKNTMTLSSFSMTFQACKMVFLNSMTFMTRGHPDDMLIWSDGWSNFLPRSGTWLHSLFRHFPTVLLDQLRNVSCRKYTRVSGRISNTITTETLIPSYIVITWMFFCMFHYFYRATLRVSAVFAVVRCPSVCPSRWWIVSTQLKISSNFFFGPVAPSL